MDTLREIFLKLEKKEKLYRDLVYGAREILHKPIKVPKALDAKSYATVYKPWYAYWDAIRQNSSNGIVIHRANRVVGVIGKVGVIVLECREKLCRILLGGCGEAVAFACDLGDQRIVDLQGFHGGFLRVLYFGGLSALPLCHILPPFA